jgi:hypothetical protein
MEQEAGHGEASEVGVSSGSTVTPIVIDKRDGMRETFARDEGVRSDNRRRLDGQTPFGGLLSASGRFR